MATGLQNYPNISTPDSDYPNGNIKDNAGAGDGTPVNKNVYSDIHQFFAKLLRLASITPSGLPESEYSGFQYITALKNLILNTVLTQQEDWHYIGNPGEPSFTNGWNNGPSGRVRFRKDALGYVHVEGGMKDGTISSAAFTMPTGYIPDRSTSFCLVQAGNNGLAQVAISSLGNFFVSQYFLSGNNVTPGVILQFSYKAFS